MLLVTILTIILTVTFTFLLTRKEMKLRAVRIRRGKHER